MLPLESFSEEALETLKKLGINTDDIIMTTCLDLDTKGDFGESWIFLTKENLYCLSANSKDFEYHSKSKKQDESKIKTKFKNPTLDKYPLEKISASYVDSFTSSNRLFIQSEEKTIGVVFSTNAKKQKLFAFIELMNRIKDGKEVKDDDSIFEQFNISCPKCGRRYDHHNRKICMHCADKNALYIRLFKYFKNHIHRLVIIFICLLAVSGMSLISPIIHGRIFVDEVINNSPDNTSFFKGNILIFVIMIFTLDMISLMISIIHSRTVNKMSIRVTQTMKVDMFSSMQKLSLAYFNSNQTGRLMNRISSDPEVIRGLYTGILPSLIINVITFIGVAIALFSMNWQLALIVFIPVPLILWIFRVKLPQLWNMLSRRWRRSSALTAVLSDSLWGIRVVKAFAKEVEEANRFRSYSDKLYQAELRVNRTYLTIFPVVSLMIGLTGTLIWGFGGTLVINKFMTLGELITYTSYIGMIFGPLQFFTNLTNNITEISNSAQRMFEVLDTPRDIIDIQNPVKLDNIKGNIEFDNVCFHYMANRPILRNMSFKINQGDYIGLVGHTGAGKSTIANLITRLYDVISGEISIDGHNIKNIEIETLRKSIAIVSQEIFIFRGTVADNIRYAKPDATMDEIIAAAKAANAHDFIVRMSRGYETLIGSGWLSGGEQQRVSIARALLLNPKILILDEATAAMDTETERLIQDAINVLVKERTTIVIAHRLSTLKECNYLFAIDNGEIAESGTHIELINKKGIYYKLYKLQSDAMKKVISGG